MEENHEEKSINKGFVEGLLWSIDRLAKPLLKPFSRNSNPISIYEEDLEPLQRMLARIRATLKDSDNLAIRQRGGEFLKLWVSELRALECSAEDIIEELEFQAFRKEKVAELKTHLRRNKRKHEKHELGIFFSSSALSSLTRKIEKLRELHCEIAFDRKALRLRKEDGEICHPHCSLRPPTSSFMDGAFHGRRDEVEKAIRLLVSNEVRSNCVPVIPIDGMGGVGKTTLVQHVFNDGAVISHFNLRIWISISEGLDVLKVTKAIRESLTEETSPCPSELDLIQQDVMSRLKGKRFLLVLDDLWNDENWEFHWRRILGPLNVGAQGSKVIVTTRNSSIAKFKGTVPSLHLTCLSDSVCFQIFQQHVFWRQDLTAHEELIPIAKEINRKCKGLPLAARVLGCLLQTELDKEHWQRVMEDLWNHEERENEIWVALRLSYDHLPLHLKRCFLYCSLFPRGYTFEKDQLVRLWKAQGFVPDSDLKLKEKGNNFFDELVERAFFQKAPCDQRFVMHDLFHELAQSIAGSECTRMDDGILHDVDKKTQHLSLVLQEDYLQNRVQLNLGSDKLDLRSLLLTRRYEHIEKPFHVKIPDFQFLQCLRALDLSHANIENLPHSIGNLIHLRYLGLRNTRIKRLPESICGLFKLQTLDLEQCCDLEVLPQGLEFLSDHLQYLELPQQYQKHTDSGKLNDIKSPSVVIECHNPECSQRGESREMQNIGKNLQIFQHNDAVEGQNAEVEVMNEELENPSKANAAMVHV